MQSQIDRSGISSSSVKQLDLVFCDLLVISSIIWKPELYSECQLPGNVPLLWSSSCSSKLEIGWALLLIFTLNMFPVFTHSFLSYSLFQLFLLSLLQWEQVRKTESWKFWLRSARSIPGNRRQHISPYCPATWIKSCCQSYAERKVNH